MRITKALALNCNIFMDLKSKDDKLEKIFWHMILVCPASMSILHQKQQSKKLEQKEKEISLQAARKNIHGTHLFST